MYNNLLKKVAIIGKPNVGKSTLFNKLTNRKLAIIDNKPGITRDRKYFEARLFDLDFIAIDTAGLDTIPTNATPEIHQNMLRQTMLAVEDADIVLFMVDGKNGLSNLDSEFVDHIRSYGKPIVLVVNKCENDIPTASGELFGLGLGEPAYIAAAHNLGLDELYRRLSDHMEPQAIEKHRKSSSDQNDSAITFALLGRPNVGKTTLLNAILQEERGIVSKEAGTTRDSTSTFLEYDSQEYEIVDTAGMRQRSKIYEVFETNAIGQSITSIRRSRVVVLVIDGSEPFKSQDMNIAYLAVKEGKGLVVVVNKCDLIPDLAGFRRQVEYELASLFVDVINPPVLYVSALYDGIDIAKILQTVNKVYASSNAEITTGALNRWLRTVVTKHSAPLGKNNRRIKIKYINQIAQKPPTFNLFSNLSASIPHHYVQYLKKELAAKFSIFGVPIRFILQQTDNPYKR